MDRSMIRLAAHAIAWSVATLVAFGLVTAIIPNPVFGREIAPEPFSIAVWVLSAPLAGIVLATYTAKAPVAEAAPRALEPAPESERGSTLGMIGGIGAFLAIGCPVCNKIVLVALGTSGALTVWAPLQPLVGAASVAILAGTAAWRLRRRARGEACAAA
ncbi:MAG: hypothetical protein WEG56_06120 [Chloroflexota bacterium]